jgi:hypothetical protein
VSESNSDFREEFWAREDIQLVDVEKDLAAALSASINTHPEIWKEAASQGVSAGSNPFELKARQGTDPATAAFLLTLAISGAKLSVKIASDLWTKIVLPWLERKYGRDAIKPKR